MKKILALLMAICLILSLVACGYNKMIDTTYEFDEAIILLPNGDVVKGKCEGWTDFEDGDQLQVKVNGKIYLTHSSNMVLIAK